MSNIDNITTEQIDRINTETIEMLKTRKLSYSSLKHFGESPMHFVDYINGVFVQSDAMVLGNVFDCMVLTPENLEEKYIVMPKFDSRTQKGKIAKALFLDANKGKECVTELQIQTAKAMYESLRRNEIGWITINYKGIVQKKVEWKDKETGFEFHGYLDKDCTDYIQDLKTGNDIEPKKFSRDAYNLHYPLQAAMYLVAEKGLYQKPFVYVCVGTKSPYPVSVFQASSEYISYGFNLYKKLIMSLKKCIEDRQFHRSYDYWSSTDYYMLNLPGYAKFD